MADFIKRDDEPEKVEAASEGEATADEAEVDYQDQGSLDEPVQTTEPPTEAASEVGTEELRTEARRRLSGITRARPSGEAPTPKR